MNKFNYLQDVYVRKNGKQAWIEERGEEDIYTIRMWDGSGSYIVSGNDIMTCREHFGLPPLKSKWQRFLEWCKNKMTPPKPVDLEMIAIAILKKPLDYMLLRKDDINLVTALTTEIKYLRARTKEFEDRPVIIDINRDKIIRVLAEKLEVLNAENERLRGK